jgi:predicted oxidoreductase
MYGAPVVVLASLAFAGALWRGGARFGPALAPAERGRRSLSEQIVGTGRFTLRFGAGRALHAAMVRAVHEAAAKRLPGYSQLAHAARLEQLARATGVDVERLAATINYAGPRRSHEFKEAVELLEQVRRRVSVKSSAGEIAHAG